MDLSPRFPKPAKKDVHKETKTKSRGFLRDTRSTKNRSKAQEREIAEAYRNVGLPARRVPGSGSFAILPGDVDVPGWLLGEAKQTRTGRLTINPMWVSKIREQAKQMGRPWYCIHAWTGEATGPYSKLVVIEEDIWYELLKELNEWRNSSRT